MFHRSTLRGAFAAAALVVAAACGGDGVSGTSGYTVVADQDEITINAGATQYISVTLQRSGDSETPVTLSVTGAPTGVTASFDPAVLTQDEEYSLITLTVAPNVPAGDYTITVRGESGDDVATTTFTLTVAAVTTLTNGVGITVAGSQYGERIYRIAVPEGSIDLTVTTSGGSGDLTLQVRHGEPPANFEFDCESWIGDTEENCAFDNPAEGDWYILLYGTTDYSGVTLTATVTVPGPPVDFVQLSSSIFHTCGLDAAGQAWCWGAGFNGELGNGGNEAAYVPTPVTQATPFAQIASGTRHTCALTSDGVAWCWGANDGGKLGDGTTIQRETPVQVATALTFTQISAGGNHTCALTAGGTAYCWGGNIFGALGDSTITDRHLPTPVFGDHVFESIIAGGSNSCGIKAGGEGWCWGVNTWGEVGNGNQSSQRAPALVTGGHSWAQIVPGGHHTCGITTAGAAYCWGYNTSGELGDGTQEFHMEGPHPVSSALTFMDIAPGTDHTCALATSGQAWCWGTEIASGVAANSSGYQLTPRQVDGTQLFSSMGSGQQSTCALGTNNRAYCWGAASSGRAGDRNPENHIVRVPTEVARPD